jgi:hypothetical protein
MKFKLNMECEYVNFTEQDAREFYKTVDPQKVAKLEARRLKEDVLEQPGFKKMKVTLTPIAG